MQKPKLDVLVVLFCYGGNGGVATILPEIATWLAKLNRDAATDERIGRLGVKKAGDIPLSMERNRMVKYAKDNGFDVIVMLDSDNVPDLYYGPRPDAKQFFQSSFDFLYERAIRGIPTTVCAPYCGPPPHPVGGGSENVYVFYTASTESDDKDPDIHGAISVKQYSRNEAAIMRGIQPCAAGPTGCIMYSTDSFDLMPIHDKSDKQILAEVKNGSLEVGRALQLLRMESWFYYEYTDSYQTQKASTEDVTNTREIQFGGIQKHGEPVVFCNWDAWAGHYKPKCVGAPTPLRVEQVSEVFAEAVRNNISVKDQKVEMSFSDEDLQSNVGTEPPKEESEPDDKVRTLLSHFSPTVFQQVAGVVIDDKTSERVIVVGDETAQLAEEMAIQSDKVVYAVGVSEEAILEGVHEKVRVIDESVGRPIDLAWKLPEQEVDIVVLSASMYDHQVTNEEQAVDWAKHLKYGGTMLWIPCGGDTIHEDRGQIFDESKYSCHYSDELGVMVVTRRSPSDVPGASNEHATV